MDCLDQKEHVLFRAVCDHIGKLIMLKNEKTKSRKALGLPDEILVCRISEIQDFSPEPKAGKEFLHYVTLERIVFT